MKHHHELSEERSKNPELHRIDAESVDLGANPITVEEHRYITKLILHLHVYFVLHKTRMFVRLEGVDTDIRQFFSKPIPQMAWESIRQFHNKNFIKFIEGRIERRRK